VSSKNNARHDPAHPRRVDNVSLMDKGKAGRPKDGGVAARDRLAEGKEVGARADFSSEPDPSHLFLRHRWRVPVRWLTTERASFQCLHYPPPSLGRVQATCERQLPPLMAVIGQQSTDSTMCDAG